MSRYQAYMAILDKYPCFANVTLVTLAEGEVNERHVDLKGAMNALFLNDLAAKTRRNIQGCVEAGIAGGAATMTLREKRFGAS